MPMRRQLGAFAAAMLVACGPADPSPGPALPEPSHPLRPPAQRGEVPEERRVAEWSIAARLDATTHAITATATLRWTNTSATAIESIPLQLYLNGMRAEDTAWMRDALRSRRTGRLDPEHAWGFIDVTSVAQVGHGPLRFVERDDPSLMDVALAAPLPAGASLELELQWTTQLPKVYARTGFAGDFHMVGQWLPVPGVIDSSGAWHVQPFTLYSEFFADFARWEVELDVPATFVVGATGTRTESWVEGDRRHERYSADMVHHFAWVAAPDLVERTREHDGIHVRQLMPPERAGVWPSHFDAVAAALDSMQARFGPYPWSTITIVHPPAGADGAAGMEYPTLFTAGTEVPMPPWLSALGFGDRYGNAFVTVHEFGHQYFQGLLASDEAKQPWLDEGMNSMANALVYIDRFPDEPEPWVLKIAGQPLHLLDGMRVQLRRAEDLVPIDTPAAGFSPDVEVYGGTVYAKTAAGMLTLRQLVGTEAFDRALADYARTWRFRHPTGDDLIAAFVQHLGERVAVSAPDAEGAVVMLDVRAYFEQLLHAPETIDLAVWDVGNRRPGGTAGWHRDASGVLVQDERLDTRPEDARSDTEVDGVAVVHRKGGLQIPVEIEVELADGTIERIVWDGRSRTKTLRFPGRRLRRVTIDPDGVLYLEARRWNNTAYAPGVEPPFSVAITSGDLGESVALALFGGVGP